MLKQVNRPFLIRYLIAGRDPEGDPEGDPGLRCQYWQWEHLTFVFLSFFLPLLGSQADLGVASLIVVYSDMNPQTSSALRVEDRQEILKSLHGGPGIYDVPLHVATPLATPAQLPPLTDLPLPILQEVSTIPTLSPAEIIDRLRALHMRQNDLDTAHDMADLRALMCTAQRLSCFSWAGGNAGGNQDAPARVGESCGIC